MKLVKIGAGFTVFCVAAGLLMVTVACFHSGVAWIPEAFSFLGRIFGF